MTRQYQNQRLYEETIAQNNQKPPCKENKPVSPLCNNSFDCNIKCKDTQLNLTVNDFSQSICIKQFKK